MSFMIACVRSVVVCLLAAVAWTAVAQQPPAESTEPPVPRAAPLSKVMEESLPGVGGILVFGGSRGTGLEVVRELVKRGEKVTAMVRESSDTAALIALKVSIVKGDALNREDLKRAFAAAPFRAAVSTLGGTRTDASVDFEGNRNVVDAAKDSGIPRVVLVTAIGAGDSKGAEPWYFGPFLQTFMNEKTKAENYLRASGLKYTIVRPGWLLDRAPSEKAILSSDQTKFSWIARADLANLVADCLKNDANVNKVLTAYDASRDHFWEVLF
jgi:uncharacterized protein YbjT (DUF2867 family)